MAEFNDFLNIISEAKKESETIENIKIDFYTYFLMKYTGGGSLLPLGMRFES